MKEQKASPAVAEAGRPCLFSSSASVVRLWLLKGRAGGRSL